MQLRGRRHDLARSIATALFVLTAALPSRADSVNAQVGTEIAGYRDSFATTVFTPSVGGRVESPTEGWSAQGRYLVDVVSAASPDVVATASPRWSETRHAGSASVGYKPGTWGGTVGGSVSYTPDYLSRGLVATGIVDLDDKRWTLTASFGYARDTIGRNGTDFSTFSRTLEIVTGSLGATRVLGPRTLFVLVLDGYVERGDPSKPYRYVPLFAPGDVARASRGASVDDVARLRAQARPLEQLPLARDRIAGMIRLAHRFSWGTLRVEERVYGDTWGMIASTTDARLLFDLGRRLVLGPTAHGHVQTATGFYRRAYASGGPSDIPALRTGDRELGALFSLSGGGGVRVGIAGEADPMALAIGAFADGTLTWFSDALYVTERSSVLGALTLEARF